MWNQHLGDESPPVPADFDAQLAELDDEHQEPVARAARQREITLRRHKDLTQEDVSATTRTDTTTTP
jgi:alpha-D-ribose 1-methylphosphonate 5-triphosphate diphosphatase PhnM